MFNHSLHSETMVQWLSWTSLTMVSLSLLHSSETMVQWLSWTSLTMSHFQCVSVGIIHCFSLSYVGYTHCPLFGYCSFFVIAHYSGLAPGILAPGVNALVQLNSRWLLSVSDTGHTSNLHAYQINVFLVSLQIL